MRNIPTHEDLIKDIENHLKKSDVKPHEFGKEHFNDSGAISRLKKGADPRLSTVIKIYNIIGS
jgi:predicted transcriptional regulator